MPSSTDISKSNDHNSKIRLRDARLAFDDVQFIVEAFDSTLPYLASIGSGEQWGPVPFSERDGFIKEALESVEQSEKHALTGISDAIHIIIAETESPTTTTINLRYRIDENKQRLLSIGTATVRENWLPSYIALQTHLALGPIENTLYLEVMITDYRAGASRKGAGAALIQGAIDYGRKAGKRTLFVDGVSEHLKFLSVLDGPHDESSHLEVSISFREALAYFILVGR